MEDFPHKELTYKIIGICMEVHNNLGTGFSEIVYKDAIEFELKNQNIQFEREKEFTVKYKETVLNHKFYADFVINDQVIIEIKSVKEFKDEFYAQCINYLKISELKIALLVNFGKTKLDYKRIIY